MEHFERIVCSHCKQIEITNHHPSIHPFGRERLPKKKEAKQTIDVLSILVAVSFFYFDFQLTIADAHFFSVTFNVGNLIVPSCVGVVCICNFTIICNLASIRHIWSVCACVFGQKSRSFSENFEHNWNNQVWCDWDWDFCKSITSAIPNKSIYNKQKQKPTNKQPVQKIATKWTKRLLSHIYPIIY